MAQNRDARFGADFGLVAGGSADPAEALDAFSTAMDDDLNVPRALAALHETVRAGNTALADGDDDAARKAMYAVVTMTDVLGLNAVAGSGQAGSREADALGVLVEAQLAARATARAAKDWAASDAIRDTLNQTGVLVEDGPDGATWSLKRD